MKNNGRIAEIGNNRREAKEERFTKSRLEKRRGQEANRDKTVKPDFLGGVGTASERFRKAWKTRNERSRFLRPWENMDTSSKGKYLAPEMAVEFDRYHQELTAFASNPANEQTIKYVLGKSAGDFQFTLRAYPNNLAKRKAIKAQANWRKAR